jgi:hypothetical protein
MLVQIRIGQFGFVQQGECRVGKVGFCQVLPVSSSPDSVVYSAYLMDEQVYLDA